MAVNLSPIGGVAAQFLDNSGNVLSGGKIFTYAAGTTTPQATYTSAAGVTLLANPIILDAAGRVPTGEIWLTDGLQYKFIIKTSTDVQIGSYDNIVGINSNFVNYTNSQEFQTATAGQTVFTLTTMAYQPGTNSLSVFVDGVNQYGPGASYAYQETSSTVVTFTSGLHVGADVKFTTSAINASSYGDAEQVSYTPPFTNSVATNVEVKLAQTVSVKDFGAVGNGVTDDTTAIQNAFSYVSSVNGGTVLFPEPSVSYRITAPITVSSYTSVVGQGRNTKIFRDFTNGFAFISINKTYVTYDNLSIYSTTPSVTSPSGGIGLQSSTYCRVSDVTITGMRQYGVWLYDTSYSTVENCVFSGWIGSYAQDSCDISALNNSSYNTIQNNKCFGGGDQGILIQDPYSGAQPTGNKILGNTIGEHTAYGIAMYVTNAYDTKTIISGNEVRDILGTSLSGASGGGIYIQSAGGTICTNNTVSNCCRSTTNFFTLAPGAIGVTLPVNSPPVIVRDNILNSVRGPCISAITLDAPVLIDGNMCSLSTVDSTVNPHCIYVSNAQRCTVSNNILTHSSPSPALNIIARSGVVVKDTSITNNSVKTTERGISVARIDTATFANVRIIGNHVEGPTTEGLKIELTANASIIGNIVEGSSRVFDLGAVTNARVEGNSFVSSDITNAVIFFSGTNTGSIISETNTLGGRVSNTGTGAVISQYGDMAPVNGNVWGVGDRVIRLTPVVGQPKGWRCTVAGNPGTWVSEGNL